INKVMSIGEVITAELMSGLVHKVRSTKNPALADVIRGVDNLRPATDVFQWLPWQARGHGLTPKEEDLLAGALSDAISGVVDSQVGQLWDEVQPDLIVSGDIVDRLQLVRKALQNVGLSGLRDCIKLFVSLGNFKDSIVAQKDYFYQAAVDEFTRLAPDI